MQKSTKVSRVNIRSALNLLPLGLVVITPECQVVLANDSALSIIEHDSILTLEAGVIVPRSAPHQRALRTALAEVQSSGNREVVGFSIGRTGKKPVSIAILSAADHRDPRLPDPNFLMLISDPEIAQPMPGALLSLLFDFTPAESSIAALLMAGCDTTRVATELNIAKSTVRNHLKHMFAKTNTRSQCELLHLLLMSPAHLCVPTIPQSS